MEPHASPKSKEKFPKKLFLWIGALILGGGSITALAVWGIPTFLSKPQYQVGVWRDEQRSPNNKCSRTVIAPKLESATGFKVEAIQALIKAEVDKIAPWDPKGCDDFSQEDQIALQVGLATPRVLSMRMIHLSLGGGAAHPQEEEQVFTADLKQARFLSQGELFKGGAVPPGAIKLASDRLLETHPDAALPPKIETLIYLRKDGVGFLFKSTDFNLPMSESNPEVIVPYPDLKEFLNPICIPDPGRLVQMAIAKEVDANLAFTPPAFKSQSSVPLVVPPEVAESQSQFLAQMDSLNQGLRDLGLDGWPKASSFPAKADGGAQRQYPRGELQTPELNDVWSNWRVRILYDKNSKRWDALVISKDLASKEGKYGLAWIQNLLGARIMKRINQEFPSLEDSRIEDSEQGTGGTDNFLGSGPVYCFWIQEGPDGGLLFQVRFDLGIAHEVNSLKDNAGKYLDSSDEMEADKGSITQEALLKIKPHSTVQGMVWLQTSSNPQEWAFIQEPTYKKWIELPVIK